MVTCSLDGLKKSSKKKETRIKKGNSRGVTTTVKRGLEIKRSE